MKEIELTAQNFKEEVIDCELPVLVDFYAQWCGPCKMQSPVLAQFAQNNENIKVCKVDVDAQNEIASAYRIESIPTLIVVKNGSVVRRELGYHSIEQLNEMIK